MPRRPQSPCSHFGCSGLSERGGYCPTHLKRFKSKRDSEYQKKRLSRSKRGYDRSHQRLRKMVMARQPICASPGCAKPGVELDHRDGDAWNRSEENLQMLCKEHHSQKTFRDHGGGWFKVELLPLGLQRPPIPVSVVCGSPGSGKTAYVRKHAKEKDVVIDLDEIKARLSGLPWYRAGDQWLRPAIAQRNTILRGLVHISSGRAWLIVSGPKHTERRFWRDALGAEIIVLEVDQSTCIERIKRDTRRADKWKDYEPLVAKWWSSYVSDPMDKVIRGGGM